MTRLFPAFFYTDPSGLILVNSNILSIATFASLKGIEISARFITDGNELNSVKVAINSPWVIKESITS